MTISDPVRILVCGSRTFSAYGAVASVLGGIDAYLGGNIVLIQGGARGADSHAGNWAAENDRPCLVFAADWNRFGKRAGYLRNQMMLDEGKPDVVWAFVDKPLAESKGTKMMVDIARMAGVPCYVVERMTPSTPDER